MRVMTIGSAPLAFALPRAVLPLLGALSIGDAASVSAQEAPYGTERVTYVNESDSTYLTATLALPTSPGLHPGIVLLSIAGTDPIVDRLVGDGYAVLQPVRRGFVAVEPLLQASYDDLAEDARAAMRYLGSRPEVDAQAIALIGQADDAPAAMTAAARSLPDVPVVLLAPPGLPGREVFRLEQLGQAERARMRPEDREALDRFVDEIADIAMSDAPPYAREYRLQSLIGRSGVQLPYNAAFPQDERQAHFFASPIWHDRLAFEPQAALARLHGPVLLVIGPDELDTPIEPYLAAVRGGLAAASAQDKAVCILLARTRHAFPAVVVSAVSSWLGERMLGEGGEVGVPDECLDEVPRG